MKIHSEWRRARQLRRERKPRHIVTQTLTLATCWESGRTRLKQLLLWVEKTRQTQRKASAGFSSLKSKDRGKHSGNSKDSVAARERALRVFALISLAFFVRSLLWLSFALWRPKAALAAPQQLTTIAIVKANARPDGATFNSSSRGSAAAAAEAATVLTAFKLFKLI